MIYVISDLHGYPIEKFLELLNKANFSEDDTLYILGDVVDRGNEGIEYLQWSAKQDNVTLLLGNHEDMMRKCDFLFDERALDLMKNLNNDQRVNLSIWMSNGAETTVKGLFSISLEERQNIFSYLNSLPLYRELSIDDKKYLLVHSGLRDFSPLKSIEDYSEYDLIWNRPGPNERYYDDIMTIFGHTPTWCYGDEYKGKIIYSDTWIDIDVGVGYGYPPILLRLDDMEQIML